MLNRDSIPAQEPPDKHSYGFGATSDLPYNCSGLSRPGEITR